MGNSTQTWRSPTSRNSWRVAALASLALFSSLASAQTDLEKAAIEQQLLVDKMAAQIAAATTSPMATAGATCSAGTTTSTEATITTPYLWVVGNVAASNGYGVYRCVNGAWAAVAGTGATRIDVDSVGRAWTVDSRGVVLRYATSWSQVGTGARDIGIGLDGSVFVIGTDSAVYRWNGSTAWVKRSGAGAAISADVNGVPVLVNAAGEIYRGWK